MPSTYSIKFKNKFTGDEVLRQDFYVEGFLSNCGYRLLSLNTAGRSRLRGDSSEQALKMMYTAIYNWLITNKLCYGKGVRKIVMSGSFGSVETGRYSGDGKLGNSTALFMLSEDIPLVGNTTIGKESGDHVLQMGEINVVPDMEPRKLPLSSKLYEITVGTPEVW